MDDFVVNVRQIGNYPQLQQLVTAQDLLLVQQGGIGGPYKCITQDGLLGQVFQRLNVGILPAPNNVGIAANAVTTPLGQRQGFNWYIDEDGIVRYLQNGPAGYWSMVNTSGDLVFATADPGEKDDQINTEAWTPIFDLTIDGGLTVGGIQISTPPSQPTDVVTMQWVQANTVASFNGRIGPVTLLTSDIDTALGISPSDTIATQTYVNNQIAAAGVHYLPATTVFVSGFNGRSGAVSLSLADITAAGGAPLSSPAFTGVPTAPTPAGTDNSPTIATTAFVQTNFPTKAFASTTYAPLASPVFTGTPSGPTATPGTNTGQLATTAYVQAAIVASTTGVSSFNTRTGAVTLNATDVTNAGGAVLASPAFTGTPTVPTASPGTTTTQIASTAFVTAAVTAATAGVSSFNTRTGAVTLQLADVTAVGGAPAASPAFSGTPTGPTATAGTSTTQLATTQFVTSAINGTVLSFNGRTGAVTLNSTDISAAGGAPLASPTFTGVPAGPTATAGTSTTQLATTQFVTSALATAGGVTTFNGRAGTVTLLTTDITNAGGAPLASPVFTGTPSAPTAAPGNNSTGIATTAFVTAAIGAAVVSFNGRTGTVTLAAADLTAVGGALLAGPAFTGVPTAPTAAPNTNTTQLATCAYVQAYSPTSVQSSAVVASPADFTTSITLAASDNGTIKICTASGAVTVTCPNTLTKDFYCTVVQAGAGQITFVAGASATLNNRQNLLHSAGQYAVCCLIVISGTGANASFVLGGDVA